MNSRQENRSKLSFTARIITKYSLERFLSICGEKISKGFLKFYKLISNLILGKIIVLRGPDCKYREPPTVAKFHNLFYST